MNAPTERPPCWACGKIHRSIERENRCKLAHSERSDREDIEAMERDRARTAS